MSAWLRVWWGEVLGVVLLLVIIGSDVVLALDGRVGNTYSEHITRLGSRMIVVPYAVGVIVGHWCLPSHLPRVPGGLGLCIAIGAVLALLDWRSGHLMARHEVPMIAWVLQGIVCGALLWSMPMGGRS